MKAQRDRIVAEARDWIGTPYRHQASCKGGGADCLGLIRGVWRELFGAEPEAIPAYTKDWSEPGNDEILWRAAQRHLREKPQDMSEIGDVLLFRMRRGSVAKHLGLLATRPEGPTFIHAYSGHGVKESLLSRPWRRRLVRAFEFPEGPV